MVKDEVDVCAGTNASHVRFFITALPLARRMEARKVPVLGGFETFNSLKLGDFKCLKRLKQGRGPCIPDLGRPDEMSHPPNPLPWNVRPPGDKGGFQGVFKSD